MLRSMTLIAAVLLAPLSPVSSASESALPLPKGIAMKLQSVYPIIVTDKLLACREFYTRHFGFVVVFEATWFLYLATPDNAHAVVFMAPDHPSRPPGPESFNGQGMFLTFQVEDAKVEYERLEHAGLTIAYPIADEAWGQRRFGLYDPSGTWVDVVQQIEPAKGYWDRYMSPGVTSM